MKLKLTALILAAATFAAAILVRTPESVALWLVESHPSLFTESYESWSRDKSFAERWLTRLINYKLSRDWITQADRRVASSTQAPGAYAWIVAARNEVRSNILNQRDVSHQAVDLAPFQRLVYGLAFCDGQNHLFAMLLASEFDDVSTYALIDPSNGESYHVTVVIDQFDQPVFVDAWSPVPAFVQMRSLSAPDIPDWPEVEADLAFELNPKEVEEADRPAKARSYFENGERRINAKAPIIPIGYFDPWPRNGASENPAGLGADVLYLKARVHHLYGNTVAARIAYEAFLSRPDGSAYLREAAQLFLSRLPHE